MINAPTDQNAVRVDPVFDEFVTLIVDDTGLQYWRDRESQLAGLIARRMAALGTASLPAYRDAYLNDPNEREHLVTVLTIGETYFFRHSQVFDALRETVIPELVARRRPPEPLRIWSAGCSIGAEPYSLSILVRRDLLMLTSGMRTQIVGTDLDPTAVEQAREARFGDWALRASGDTLREECFDQDGKNWVLKPQFSRDVEFFVHNLVRDGRPGAFAGPVDLILCRNVLIYFSVSTIRAVIGRLRDALSEGGWLVVGHSEVGIPVFEGFDAIEVPGAVLFRKRTAPNAAPVIDNNAPSNGRRQNAPLPAPSRGARQRVHKIADDEKSIGRDAPRQQRPKTSDAPSTAARPDAASVRRFLDLGQWARAKTQAEDALTKDFLSAELHRLLAAALSALGDARAAADSLRRALYIDRDYAPAHFDLGCLLQSAGQPHAAARSFRNVERILAATDPATLVEPDLPAEALTRLAKARLDLLIEDDGEDTP